MRAEGRAGGGVGGLGGGLRLSGKQRDLAIYTHTPIMYSWLYTVYELACAYSTQACFFFFLKRDLLIQLFFSGGAPCPTPLSDPLIEKHILLELQLPLSPCDFKKQKQTNK